MQQIFVNRLDRPIPLNVVREKGTSDLYFAYPTTLRQGDAHAILRRCKECSARYGAQLQAVLTNEISPMDRTTPHFVVRILAWRCHERDVLTEVRDFLQQILHVQVVPTYRQ